MRGRFFCPSMGDSKPACARSEFSIMERIMRRCPSFFSAFIILGAASYALPVAARDYPAKIACQMQGDDNLWIHSDSYNVHSKSELKDLRKNWNEVMRTNFYHEFGTCTDVADINKIIQKIPGMGLRSQRVRFYWHPFNHLPVVPIAAKLLQK